MIYDNYHKEGKRKVYKSMRKIIECIYQMKIEVKKDKKYCWIDINYLGYVTTCFCVQMNRDFNYVKILIYIFCNLFFGRILEFVANIEKFKTFKEAYNSIRKGCKKIRHFNEVIEMYDMT